MSYETEVARALTEAENEGWPSHRSSSSNSLKREIDQDVQLEETLAHYGITCVPVTYFHYGTFRYTNAKDAVAQARRDEALRPTTQYAG